MSKSATDPRIGSVWHALCVKPRHERVTSDHLRSRKIEEFAPVYRVKRRWSDRIKSIEQPLFPGYVFCRFRPEQRRDVLTIPCVTSLVSFGNIAATVSEEEIEAIRTITNSGLPYGPFPYILPGDRVRIAAGCMQGLTGTLVRVRDELRVVVNVELLKRSVSVEIDREMLCPDSRAVRIA